MKIGVVGIWHLGEIVAVSLAELGHEVIGVDENQLTIDNLKKFQVPLEEPGLDDLLKKNIVNGRLNFSSDFSNLKDCDCIFMTYDTPVGEDDEPDLSVLFESAEKIASYIKPDALFVVMSQVPVGTTKKLFASMKEINPLLDCGVVYFPENLQLGQAVKCFLQPDRFVVGIENEDAKKCFETIISGINCPRQYTNIASAEMTKHALNAFLATSLSFIYNISDICEKVGADVTAVAEALRSDKRIGHDAYLDSSLGFSGGTLMRDLKTLNKLSVDFNCSIPVIKGVLDTNEGRRKKIVQRLENIFQIPLSKLKLGILGITYKPCTPTLRRSLGLEIVEILLKNGVSVSIYDPGAQSNELREKTGLEMSVDPYEMALGCHGVLLVTAWPEFQSIDFVKLISNMSSPYVFFDTRNFLKQNEEAIHVAGLKYIGMGR